MPHHSPALSHLLRRLLRSPGRHTCLTLPVMHSTRYKPRYGLLMAHRSVPRTMTLNDNPGGEIEGKITRGEEAYELLAAAYIAPNHYEISVHMH